MKYADKKSYAKIMEFCDTLNEYTDYLSVKMNPINEHFLIPINRNGKKTMDIFREETRKYRNTLVELYLSVFK